jgi:hypothetical protein
MKCFYHPQIDAVAICKNCSKGICFECAVDVGNGVACKGKCEAEVQAVNQMIQRGIKNRNISGNYYKKMTVIWLLIGLAALITSLLLWKSGRDGIGLIPLAAVALIAAFIYGSMVKITQTRSEISK